MSLLLGYVGYRPCFLFLFFAEKTRSFRTDILLIGPGIASPAPCKSTPMPIYQGPFLPLVNRHPFPLLDITNKFVDCRFNVFVTSLLL